ncbi:related to CBP3-required for assembly of cytochrome bc1 complex [Phialocephala subalpina]|uniref:Related to CBP3-required for assembly of cytochrome bc1 complex n=1 Tax=Phialocephala subalpina TaxID=576137 RepID=A0A1L7X8Z5_9HELO|nr:related to CBP3-required for assembly of cytochrome bc1 complex [Phialocephala subalpina]
MASKTCVSCLRTLQRRSRSIAQTHRASSAFTSARAFTTTSSRHVELPEPNATATTSIPPVTPKIATGNTTDAEIPATRLKAAREISKLAGGVTETYTAYGATELLYKECAKQADYTMPQLNTDEEVPKTEDGVDLGVGDGWWHTELGLPPTFSTWSQVTMLHMYFLSARFRCFEAHIAQPWQQHLLDHFFYDAENKMTINHGMHARGTRNKYLKDLFVQWRGVLAAYDEGLFKGDAVLAAAVWRNIFKANEEVDVRKLAQIVSYMRRTLKGLDGVQDETIMHAQLEFGSPASETSLVKQKSPMIDLPFSQAPGKDLPRGKQS